MKEKPMEISIGDYGRHIFDVMAKEDPAHMPDHFKSIREKAEPLVRELLRLNSEMQPSGYRIIGYKDASGKKQLSERQRIAIAQKRLWGVEAGELAETDFLWLYKDLDYEMHVGEQPPCSVEYIKKDTIGVNVDVWSTDVTVKVSKDTLVLRAPADWQENKELYGSWDYWLEQADKLGI